MKNIQGLFDEEEKQGRYRAPMRDHAVKVVKKHMQIRRGSGIFPKLSSYNAALSLTREPRRPFRLLDTSLHRAQYIVRDR
jgi:hypothetical protein